MIHNRIRNGMMRTAVPMLGIALVCGCSQGLKRGEIAPDFVLESTNGDAVGLYESSGDVTLLCFWAVGCPPCRAAAPHLQRLQEKHGNRGLTVLAVNAWNEPPALVRGFLEEEGLRYTVLLNGADVHQDQYQGRGVPCSYLIDRDRIIQYVSYGWSSAAGRNVESRINKLLGEARQ